MGSELSFNRRSALRILGATLALSVTCVGGPYAAMSEGKPPNVILIMSDDMGMSDIEPFGQTIVRTPALMELAREGVRFSNFHVLPVCSPTRAALLTGVDIHLAGLGTMGGVRPLEAQQGEGYLGMLNDGVKTIAEVLEESGYTTFISGKWHLGSTPTTIPPSRGFDRSYVMLDGGGSHWDHLGLLSVKPETTFQEDGKVVERPAGVFSSDLFTDKFLFYLKDAVQQGKPFMGYLALQAVHDPLHAPKALIDKYKGRFSAGYDVHRREVFERMKEMGVIPAATELDATPPLFKPWSELTRAERAHQERLMEVYAAMLENMDANIARVLDALREAGVYNDTIIIFLSDNGPSAAYMDAYFPNADGKWIAETFDMSFDNIGAPRSFVGVGPGWASASATPFRLFKTFLTEGGTRSPLIVKMPAVKNPGGMYASFVGVEDLFPTLMELTGAERGDTRKGVPLAVLKGASIAASLRGERNLVHGPDYERAEEFWGQKTYRKGNWKLIWLPVPFGTGQWQLYDTSTDPGETQDLALRQPDLLAELSQKYERWADEHNVVRWDYNYLNAMGFDHYNWAKGMRSQAGFDLSGHQ